MTIEIIKKALPYLIGFCLGVMSIESCFRKESLSEEPIIVDSSTTITSDTNYIVGDTLKAKITEPTIINDDKDSIKYIAKWYPSPPIHDTIKDTITDSVFCYIPILLYSDTVRVDSLSTVWYTARVEGELSEIELGLVPINTIIRDSIRTEVKKKYLLKDYRFYSGVDFQYSFMNNNINQIGIPLTVSTPNKFSFTIRPGYEIDSKSFNLGGGILMKLN